MKKEITAKKKFTNEQLRTIYEVCSRKELYGNWKKIAEVLNSRFDTDFDESAFRKKFQSYTEMKEACRDIDKDVNAECQDINIKIEELRRERQKINALNIERNRNTRHDGRFELFYESIRNVIPTLTPPKIEYVEDTGNANEYALNEYVLMLTDIHYGADFNAVNNNYSREECKRRFGVLLSTVSNYVRYYNITHLNILNLGDSIQGILRVSDLQINDTSMVMCVVEISQIIADFLNRLSAYCNITYKHITSANHGQVRPIGTKASELAGEDMEKIICNYIKDTLADNDRVVVEFDLSKEYLEFEVAGFNCIAEHGHRVKNLNKYLAEKTVKHRKIYDYGFLGHYHSGTVISVGEGEHHNMKVFVAPSFVGSCPYADSLNVGAKASANILRFNGKYGHVGTEEIILN